MRIAISVCSHSGQSIWESALWQSAAFLARSLRALPQVRAVDFIDVGDQGALPAQMHTACPSARRLGLGEAGEAVDVIVQLAGELDAAWLALQRRRGKKVVFYGVEQPHAALAQASLFARPGAGAAVGAWDAVWLPPMFAPFSPMLRALHRCPVREAPYLWSPVFVQTRAAEIAAHGLHFGWVPAPGASPRAPLRVALFESNRSVTRTCSIAMLACDEAHRAQPGSVGALHVLNSLHMKDHATLLHLAHSLDVVRAHKAAFHGRHDLPGFMAQHADAVVSHQWSQPQSHADLDVLSGGYPLIHNSPWLHSFGAGYYYPGFDAAEGGRQLLQAWQAHDDRLPAQRRAAQALFAAVDPLAPAVLAAHARLLGSLCETPASKEATA